MNPNNTIEPRCAAVNSAKILPLRSGQPTPVNAPISNQQFLQTIFGDDASAAIVTSFLDDPAAIPKDRRGICWAARSAGQSGLISKSNQYFCISLFNPLALEDGSTKPARRKSLFQAGYCIVVDDVKDKIPISQAEKLPPPSWRLETSPGNEQWGYLFDKPETNRDRLEALLDGLVAKGLAPDGKDPGMKGVTRYVRLPEGHNLKGRWAHSFGPEGFPCRMLEWQPERRYSLEQLAEAYQVPLPSKTPGWITSMTEETDKAEPPLPEDIAGDHPVLQALGNRVLSGVGPDNKVDITCPWVSDHSDQDDSGTAIWLHANGLAGYRCHHGHCADKESLEFMDWCREQPGWEENLNRWQQAIAQKAFAVGDDGAVPETADVAAKENAGAVPEATGVDTETRRAIEADQKKFRAAIEEVQKAMDRLVPGASKYLNVPNCWRIWSRTGRISGKERLILLSDSGMTADFLSGKFMEQAIRRYGRVFNGGQLQAENRILPDDLAELSALTHKLFLHNLEGFRQYSTLRISYDPFIDEIFTVIIGDELVITKPLVSTLQPRRKHNLSPEQATTILADYKTHFPELDGMLDWILATRLARSRRKGSLYHQATSDFGKNFFWNGVLGDAGLGISYATTMEDVEVAVGQRPSGINPDKLASSWLLFVDEVKIFKREIKNLDSSIRFSPKFKGVVEVPLYGKVFCSAESIDSFVGDYGVERQFLNRFSYLRSAGRLPDRQKFNRAGPGVYLDVIADYAGKRLTAGLARWRKEGREAAERWATGYLDEFHTKFSLEDHAGSLDDIIKEVAEEIRQSWLATAFSGIDPDIFLAVHPNFGSVVAVRRPTGKIKSFLAGGAFPGGEGPVSRAEIGKVMQKAGAIRDMLDAGGPFNKAVALQVAGESERRNGKFLIFRPF